MISSREVIEKTISRIVLGDSRTDVFTKVYDDKARAEAAAADSRNISGISLGSLDGVVVSVKDSFDIQGEATTAGSRVLKDAPLAKQDALVVKRLRRAGAIILGKTSMSEFAFTGLGLNPSYGTPGNALDPDRLPGGSSAGAGVSVAEDTSEISIGTDTGGSVRIPASFNGVVGFKPSFASLPTDGIFPLSKTLDTVGPLARTVQSCADAYAVLSGEEASTLPNISISGLRIAVPRGVLFSEMDSMVSEGFERSLILLEKSGAQLIDCSIDDLIESQYECQGNHSIAGIEVCTHIENYLETQEPQIDPYVFKKISQSRHISATQYIRLLQRRHELMISMEGRLVEYDVLALPTTPVLAPLIKHVQNNETEMKRLDDLILRNPQIANFFNLTSISLPMPKMSFPSGFMLMMRSGEDSRLLMLSKAIETIFFDNNS